jgi:hypothetical protein
LIETRVRSCSSVSRWGNNSAKVIPHPCTGIDPSTVDQRSVFWACGTGESISAGGSWRLRSKPAFPLVAAGHHLPLAAM